MCGLWGVINKNNYYLGEAQRRLLPIMAFMGTTRGEDGTGIITLSHGDKTNSAHSASLIKHAGTPDLLFKTKEWQDHWERNYEKKVPFAFLGHNRKTTFGESTSDNAHPFKKENIMLFHNGSLKFKTDLPKEYDVDTKWVLDSILKDGIEETIKNIEMAYALIWVDTKEHTINICRNTDRPLAILEGEHSWYYMSEETTLRKITDHYKMFSLKKVDVTPHTLYTMNYKTGRDTWEQRDLPKPKVITYYGGSNNYPSYPTTPKSNKATKGEFIAFRIISKVTNKDHFDYTGKALYKENLEVFFSAKEEYHVSTKWTGMAIGQIKKAGHEYTLIKHKSLLEIKTESTGKVKEKTTEDNTIVTMADGDTITMSEFNKLKEKRCAYCFTSLQDAKPEEVGNSPTGYTLLCSHCLSESFCDPESFMTKFTTRHAAGIMQ